MRFIVFCGLVGITIFGVQTFFMKKLSLFIFLLSFGVAFGQKDLTGGEILHKLKKLQNPTRVLYWLLTLMMKTQK